MKVTVLQENLARGLSIVARAVASRSTLPVLGNILLATDGGLLRLSATNLEIGLSCWVPAKIEAEGAITLPAKTLVDVVGTYPNDEIKLTLDTVEQAVKVKCGKSQTKVKGIAGGEFPPMPASDKERILVDAAEFKLACTQTVIAVAEDEARPVLNGVRLLLKNGKAILDAADGFRLSRRTVAIPEVTDAEAIIPSKAIETLGKVMGETLGVAIEAGRVIFRSGDVELVAQLVEGKYPDLDQVIPSQYATRATLPTAALAKAVKQTKVFARDGSKIATLTITPQNGVPGSIKVSSQAEVTGNTESTVEADIEGGEMTISFNVDYLSDALSVIKTPKVILDVNAPTSPGVLRQAGDDSYLHVLMPMHLGA